MDKEKPKIIINPTNSENNEIKGLDGSIHHTIELENRQINYFQQLNGNDCGPCLLLNMQDALGAQDRAGEVTNVQKIRQWISEDGISGRNVQKNQWLVVSELQDYIASKLHLQQKIIKTGVKYQYVEQPLAQNLRRFTILSQNKNHIGLIPEVTPTEIAQDQRNKFIWGIYNGSRTEDRQGNHLLNGGNHYTGYLQTRSGIYLFDSRNNTFVPETQAELDDFIMHTVNEPRVVFQQTEPQNIEQSPQITISSRQTEHTDNTPQKPANIEVKNRTDTNLQRIRNTIKNIFD